MYVLETGEWHVLKFPVCGRSIFFRCPPCSTYGLAQHMSGAWASFAHGLDPNFGNFSLHWPDYRVAGQNMVFVADEEHVEEDLYRKQGLALWIEQRIQGCTGLRAGV